MTSLYSTRANVRAIAAFAALLACSAVMAQPKSGEAPPVARQLRH